MTSADEVASTDFVTDLHRPPADARPGGASAAARGAEAATQVAEAAARMAGVQVRVIADLDDLEAVYRLYDRIWRPDPKNPPVTTELLRALTKAGNYVSGAFDGAELVGACVGFFSAPAGTAMHSHVAGVSPAALGRSIGFALKQHQRAWAMQRCVGQIAWTFDPLVSRNAYFNLVKLGAVASEYLPNFYGGMNDGINGTGDTDRLLVRWELTAAEVVAASTGKISPADAETERRRGAVIALARSDQGKPVAGKLAGETSLVAVPHDVEDLRRTDPGCAQQWRIAVRDVLATAMAAGSDIAGFDKTGWYVIRRHAAHREESR
ncbi:MAG: GNAT family N-acetyltransferase [Streptosporangiaceae bacterium]